jgi:hypothetical protein
MTYFTSTIVHVFYIHSIAQITQHVISHCIVLVGYWFNSILTPHNVMNKLSTTVLVWRMVLPCLSQLVVTEMSQPTRNGNNSSLTKLKLQLELTKPSTNTGLNIPTLGDARHTVTVFECGGLVTVSPGFYAGQILTLCLLK